MSSTIDGRVVDENGNGLADLHVLLRMPTMLFGNEIGNGITGSAGTFEFSYIPDSTPAGPRRDLELVVQDAVGRVLHRESMEDTTADRLTLAQDVTIRTADRTGFLVTLGTGQATRVSQGNAVTWMIDDKAFHHAAGLLRGAQKSIVVSQLFFAVPQTVDENGESAPGVFDEDETRERPNLIFDFGGVRPNPETKTRVTGARPERLLVDAARRGADVRVLLHAFEVPLFIKIVAGVLIFPFAGTDGVRVVAGELLDDDLTDTDELVRYVTSANVPNLEIRPFEQPVLTAGVLHAKFVLVDDERALSIGSPFGQGYVDGHRHHIDEPFRGGSNGFPKHDAGFAVTGPAVADIRTELGFLWKTASNAPLPPIANVPQPDPQGADGISAIQLVRTLSSGRFTDPSEGEKGILEAYLRAIANAKDFIYLETQYFTDDHIGYALVEAMKRNRSLQTMIVLPIEPDVPTYPRKQRRLITRIREGIGEVPGRPRQFGVFTRWAHTVRQPGPSADPRPAIVPVYIHAKVGIVDNTWATVGSANLDGLSLDSSLVSDVLRKLFNTREQRAIEMNGVFLNDVDGQPPTDVIDLLRRKLWAEHLGFFSLDEPDFTEDLLKNRPQGGWLNLWRDRAEETLRQLQRTPQDPVAGATVLPWPDEDETYKKPRVHLDALGIKSHKIVPLKSTRKFDFMKGTWDEKSKAEWDFP